MKKEREMKKRIKLVKDGKEQVFSQFLIFLKMVTAKGIMIDHIAIKDEVLILEKLYNKRLQYYFFCLNIISALAFCHQNQLTIEKKLSLEAITFCVKIFKLI